jgi:endonuclease YncB( thermonuclease family)
VARLAALLSAVALAVWACTAAPTAPPGLVAGPRGDAAPVIVQGPVTNVVDGDTIDLHDGTRVRLAIVDTPEIHGGVQPCGAEASDFTGRFLAGQTVAIYRPDRAPRTDRNGRTLGEVVRVSDGASLNVALVAAGLARVDERFVHEDPDLAARLEAAARTAAPAECRGA